VNNKLGPEEWETLAFHPASVKKHRFIDCHLYDECLNIAVKRNWKGFTCFFCSFKKEKIKEKENANR